MARAYGVWVHIGHSGGVNVSANKDGSISVACVWQPLVHGWFKRNTNAVMLSLGRLVGWLCYFSANHDGWCLLRRC